MSRMQTAEFQEIGHSGGQVIFKIVTGPDGRRQYQVTWSHSRSVPSALFAVWALPQGVAVAGINMGGIGTPWNAPPVAGCYPVMISSDSQGNFGHQCPSCRGYWRNRSGTTMCPYCGARGERLQSHLFLTEAQERYVAQYCAVLNQALDDGKDGDHVIDMDAVADAVGKDIEKPAFYYAEQSQQKKFKCHACGGVNDIIGRYCYCSQCGTRNDLHELETDTLVKIRTKINDGGDYSKYASDAVGAFDIFVGKYAEQLVKRIPLKPKRKAKIERMRFHNLEATAAELKSAFDIDILHGLKPEDIAFATRMFHRRHVYEHNGGEVDQKYIDDSGDTSVKLKQAIRETQQSVHQLIGCIAKMAENLHNQFHEIFPPAQEAIKWHEERQKMEAVCK